MAASKRSSYAWARHLDASPADPEQLSEAAQQGLEWAQELADNGYERAQNPRYRPDRLTPEQLAAEEGIPAALLKRRITLARRHFFAHLSDAAITKRVQRQGTRRGRRCRHPRCRERIPPAAHRNRRYCPTHSSGAARTQRHRAARASDAPAAADT
jgi:hypothetical protein